MVTSVQALCSDFYVNQKVALKMDLPSRRETVLDMFDRVRRELPLMDRLRRYEEELALESPDDSALYCWLALRKTSIRSGWVNPESLEEAYRLHRLILEVAPYYLSISPLDVSYMELVYGFDLPVEANRNEVVLEALLGDSPLQHVIDHPRETLLDMQPFLGFSLTGSGDLQAFVEVKTRTHLEEVAQGQYRREPISVYLTVRKHGPLRSIDEFAVAFGSLAGHLERLAEDRVIPHVVVPLHRAIGP
jgi:hypothetical protein